MNHRDIPYQVEIDPMPTVHVSHKVKQYVRDVLRMDPYKSNIGFQGRDVWVWNSRRVELFSLDEMDD